MRNTYNNYQKQAQLKRLLLRLDRLVREDRFQALPAREQKSFVSRLRRLIRQLRIDLSGLKLRPALMGILTAFGIGTAASQAQAQNFLPQISNPFGITPLSYYEAKPCLVDIDNDGDLDLFSGSADGIVFYMENIGTTSVPLFDTLRSNPFGIAGGSYYVTVDFQDLDGDGDFDFLLGEGYPIGIVYQENTGTNAAPVFGAPAVNPFGINFASVSGYEAKIAGADMDNDGDIDIIAGINYGDILYFQNTGTDTTPAFAAPTQNSFGLSNVGYYATPSIADLDNDGDLDVGIWTNTGDCNYFENTGTVSAPAFAAPVTNPFGIQPGYYYTGATLGDLDNDSDLDLIIGITTGEFLYQENSPTTANQAPILTLGTNQDSICTIDTLGPISVIATDPDLTTPTVSATSTNQAVIPDANISLSGTAPNYQLTAIPISVGTAEIVVVAADDSTSTSDTIVVDVSDCSIAIDESFFAKEFEVYPNPANRILRYNLELHSAVNGLRVELVDLYGRTVYAEQVNDGGSTFKGKLDVSEMAAGVYFLRVCTELYRFNRQVVIE